ncbi:MAG: ion transporter [Stygiobacter sp.]
MKEALQKIVNFSWFQNFIMGVILLAGVVIGLETSHYMLEQYRAVLKILDTFILSIFVIEIIFKMGAQGNRPWLYFRNPWNVFDFIIVAVCLLPLNSQFVAVLRLARILRVLRLVTVLPRLQILVGALLKSIPSMGYVGLLLFLHFYIYAVMATFIFGMNDPLHFGSLGASLLTLFQVVTFEGWVEVMRIQMLGSAQFGYEGMEHLIVHSQAFPIGAPLFFISFIVIGGMIILNLFIGVIMNSMQESQAEAVALVKKKEGSQSVTWEDIAIIEHQLEELKRQLSVLRHRLGKST